MYSQCNFLNHELLGFSSIYTFRARHCQMQKLSFGGRSFNKVTGNVLKRGPGRAPGRLIIKLFGSDKAKKIMKIGKGLKSVTKGLKLKGCSIKIVGNSFILT